MARGVALAALKSERSVFEKIEKPGLFRGGREVKLTNTVRNYADEGERR